MIESHFVEPVMLAELKRKREYLVKHIPQGDSKFRTELFKSADIDASYNSRNMEPDKRSHNYQKIGREKDFIQSKAELKRAQEYAYSNFKGEITQQLLLSLGGIIEQKSGDSYRTEGVKIKGFLYDTPPRPEKVPEQMEALLLSVNNPSLSPVERAVLFHFHFLRIHPFMDGNGRTARFVQNMILVNSSYAPAILPVGERNYYNELIHRARQSFKERESDGIFRAPELIGMIPNPRSSEFEFYNYFAGKINVGMDTLLDRFQEIPFYQIDLKGAKDPGEFLRVKKILVNYFARRGEIADVSICDRKNGRLELRAQITADEIEKLIGKKTNLKHKIFKID
ncbi:Fic family protein [Candidatus Pacearchaeota archaeon]|nr:Fic family protein [Candidatus Pacearchaeota archaeon]